MQDPRKATRALPAAVSRMITPTAVWERLRAGRERSEQPSEAKDVPQCRRSL